MRFWQSKRLRWGLTGLLVGVGVGFVTVQAISAIQMNAQTEITSTMLEVRNALFIYADAYDDRLPLDLSHSGMKSSLAHHLPPYNDLTLESPSIVEGNINLNGAVLDDIASPNQTVLIYSTLPKAILGDEDIYTVVWARGPVSKVEATTFRAIINNNLVSSGDLTNADRYIAAPR